MNKSFIPPQIKPENIALSETKSPTMMDDGTKVVHWGPISCGDCTMDDASLQLGSDGWGYFTANVYSSGSNDSWGLSFHLRQANGFSVWDSGWFWSPTIGTGGTTPWYLIFQYPAYLFDTIALANFDNHC
jgi:hypothetical protein